MQMVTSLKKRDGKKVEGNEDAAITSTDGSNDHDNDDNYY